MYTRMRQLGAAAILAIAASPIAIADDDHASRETGCGR